MPHLGEEAKGWWGIWVVNRELDVSLGEQTEGDCQHMFLQTAKPDFRSAVFKSFEPERLQGDVN